MEAVDPNCLMLTILHTSTIRQEVNWDPLSDTMLEGQPCRLETLSAKMSAYCFAIQ